MALAQRGRATADAGTVEFLLAPDGRVLLPRDEHAPPGRASGHRAGLRASTSSRAQLRGRGGASRCRSHRTTRAPAFHAIEARVCAEDPDAGFPPQAGRLLAWVEPWDREFAWTRAWSPDRPWTFTTIRCSRRSSRRAGTARRRDLRLVAALRRDGRPRRRDEPLVAEGGSSSPLPWRGESCTPASSRRWSFPAGAPAGRGVRGGCRRPRAGRRRSPAEGPRGPRSRIPSRAVFGWEEAREAPGPRDRRGARRLRGGGRFRRPCRGGNGDVAWVAFRGETYRLSAARPQNGPRGRGGAVSRGADAGPDPLRSHRGRRAGREGRHARRGRGHEDGARGAGAEGRHGDAGSRHRGSDGRPGDVLVEMA